MIRAVIFDCFGVIITDALRPVVAEKEATDPATAQQIVQIVRENNRGVISPAESNRQIAALLGISVQSWRHRIHSREVKNDQLLSYIVELRKHYKTALLSNIAVQSLHRRFSEEELRRYFDVLVISGELGVIKPEPEIYLRAASELNVTAAECIMVDDRQRHCDGARVVGMSTVLYEDFRQTKRDLEKLLK
jgi:HAD superfamily hydrolase (TIGR01509 family)